MTSPDPSTAASSSESPPAVPAVPALSPTPSAGGDGVADSPAEGAAAGASTAWLQVFLSTAGTVFLAELGDKTQLAALLLAAESGRPVVVFIGASLALVCSSLVGVLLGRWLSSLMAPQQLERAAGVLMVGLGLWLGRQAVLHLAPTATPPLL
ncbi:MAG: TMEM165/GDT1 family protein [Cyanobacteriota bacterium]|nr:TMEM165/GDT1 family protein [Cyanobacteriota bacterium]